MEYKKIYLEQYHLMTTHGTPDRPSVVMMPPYSLGILRRYDDRTERG